MRKPSTNFLLSLSFGVLMVCAYCSCGNHEDAPPLTRLSQLKQTEFVPTVENNLDKNKNVIYAPAFLYAWNGVKKLFKSPIITTGSNSTDFKLINNSNSFENSLHDNEYEADVSLADGEIESRAFFNVALPFPSKLQKIDGGILFSNKTVLAFGMNYFADDVIKFTRILFYKDDDSFIIKLSPKDTSHEIILVKGLQKVNTLAEAVKQTNNLIKNGNQEKMKTSDSWKYEFREEDSFAIPAIKFNIETNYKSIEGQSFKSDGAKHSVATAYQRTSLILDENGAAVQSEAYSSLDSVGEPPKIHPKNMTFNKPFFIIIRHTGSINPYFVMKVENAELLIKK